jgi:porin
MIRNFSSVSATIAFIALAAFLVLPVQAQTASPSPAAGPMTPVNSTATAPQPSPPPAEPPPPPAEGKPYDLRTANELAGDWGGARTALQDAGFSMRLAYNTQFMWNLRGGRETESGFDTGGSYDWTFLFDISRMFQLPPGTEFFFRAKGNYGGEASDFDAEKIGGLFKTNGDAGTEEPIFVDKWWLRQRLRIFRNNDLELRFGRLATVKDLIDTSTLAGSEDEQFLNSALFGNPTIPHQAGLGVYANCWATPWLYVKGAVVDPESQPRQTNFNTAFHGADRAKVYWELGVRPEFATPKGKLAGTYRVGAWYDPGPRPKYFDDLGGLRAPRAETDNLGVYTGFDQFVWKENDGAGDVQGLCVFARYGYAPSRVYRLEHFWSLGAQYVGLLPGRDKDVLGFGFAQGILSEDYREVVNPKADRESVYELYYAYVLTPWCIITPDVQVITNPGGDADDRDAVIAGLRFRILF